MAQLARSRVVLTAELSVGDAALSECRACCQQLADLLREEVSLQVTGAALAGDGERFLPRSSAPMAAAPFVWRDDGRPDWGAMWTSFCELALFGGPPHRGDADALRAPALPPESGDAGPALGELRRGIWETTGLFAEPADPGWLAVTCDSPRMAAWLCASIILENVEARCEDERLYLPAGEAFTLKNEVKSVITVLAKTHHYWQQHVAGPAD
jgi:sirohydrochlorin cobaltochelatase